MTSVQDSRLVAARSLAQSGAWRRLLDLVRPYAEDPGEELGSDLVLLYAEALVRAGLELEASDWLTRVLPTLAASREAFHYRNGLNLLGVSLFAMGRLDDANKTFSTTLELGSQAEDYLLLARAQNNLGAIASLQGRHDDALSYYRLAIPTYQRLGSRRGIAETHHNMAITFRQLEQLDLSDEEECRAIGFAARGVSPRVSAMGRVGRAEIAYRRGDLELAEATARIAIEEFRQLDDPINEADARRLLGTAIGDQKRYDEALEAFDGALKIATERGHALTEAESLRDRAILNARRGLGALAMTDARRAMALFEQMGATREKEQLKRDLLL